MLPEGTIVSARPPDGAVFIYWEGTQALLAALLQAFSGPLGARAVGGDQGSSNLHSGVGFHPDGTPWASVGQCGGEQGPYGATDAGDAETFSIGTYQANGLAPAIESIEHDFPVVVMRREPLPDTGGPGFNRGGASLVKDSLWFQSTIHNCISLRWREPSGFGVHGGQSGATGGLWFWEPDGEPLTEGRPLDTDAYRDATPISGRLDTTTNAPSAEGEYVWFGRRPVWQTPPGSILRVLTNGGGGWGDPYTRDPQRVCDDVRDGYVTIAGAARDYGVVVVGDPEFDPEGLRIDVEATARLRA